MQKLAVLFFLFFTTVLSDAQPVEVRADYNGVGDVDFVAYNNTKAPLFVYVILGDLENTYYPETLPIVKKVESGFNPLFTLERNLSGGSVRFHHEIKYFRSNPVGDVHLDFPYLIPFAPGKKVESVLVENIDGFMGLMVPKSWSANGFKANPDEDVFAARNAIITEITGASRDEGAVINYNGWTYAVTVLQSDGTLACYKNVTVPDKTWKVGDKIYAGQVLGQIAPGAKELVFMVYHEKLQTDGLTFVVPLFVLSKDNSGLILSGSEFTVVHPVEIRGMEMDKREKRKFLK